MLQKLRTTWTNLWQALTRLASKPAARFVGSALALLLVLGAVGIALLEIPRWQATQATEDFDAENEARRTLGRVNTKSQKLLYSEVWRSPSSNTAASSRSCPASAAM